MYFKKFLSLNYPLVRKHLQGIYYAGLAFILAVALFNLLFVASAPMKSPFLVMNILFVLIGSIAWRVLCEAIQAIFEIHTLAGKADQILFYPHSERGHETTYASEYASDRDIQPSGLIEQTPPAPPVVKAKASSTRKRAPAKSQTKL